MKILVQAYCLDEHNDFCDFMILDLSPEWRREFQAARETFQMAKSRHSHISSLNLWGIPGDFYGGDIREMLSPSESKEYDKGWLLLPENFALEDVVRGDLAGPGQFEELRTAGDLTVICGEDFYFSAYIKHCDIQVECVRLPFNLAL